MKKRLMELIDNLPPHEGKTFAEALAEHLIANDVTIPVRCKTCACWGKRTENEKGFIICPKSGMKIHTEAFCSEGEPKEGYMHGNR